MLDAQKILKCYLKKADIYRQVCFRKIPVIFKKEYNWCSEVISKDSPATIHVVDPGEGILLLDVLNNSKPQRVISFISEILPFLTFKNPSDQKYVSQIVEKIPWTSIIYNTSL